ncbi:MAG: thioredoxin domain-containing protein [Chitinophagales bacterium]|nr:thioredoxin domain-containing protein [Chitinophagales bacterium]
MKPIFILSIAMLSTFCLQAQTAINFEQDNWESILNKAKETDKIIFLDAYASWCGPCKRMSKDVFTHAEIAPFYNDNFINAKIDMEKGEGPELARKYQVRAYPTLLYIDGNGEVVHQALGYHDPKQFYELGKKALDPSSRLSGLNERYTKGDRDPEFLYQYARASMNAMAADGKEIAQAYLKTQSDWKTPRNMELIMDAAESANSDLFDFILDNKSEFEALYGEEVVAGKVQRMIINSLGEVEGDDVLVQVESLYNRAYPENAPRLIANFKMNYYGMIGDNDQFAKAAIDYFDQYGSEDSNELNNFAWAFYENVDNEAYLEKAVGWAKKSVELSDEYYNNDTLAALYYKLGQKRPAKKAAEHAIEIAKQHGDDYSSTQSLLDQIKKM